MIHNSPFIQTSNGDGVNGWMIPFAKTSDKFWNDYDIKYVYATSINPGCKKGPNLHLKRECRLCSIYGICKVVVKDGDEYIEYELNHTKPCVLAIEAGKPFCVLNNSLEICILINVANHCWTVDDQDNHQVLNWNYGK